MHASWILCSESVGGGPEAPPSRQLHAQAPRVAAPPLWGEVLTQACSVVALTGKDVHSQFHILYEHILQQHDGDEVMEKGVDGLLSDTTVFLAKAEGHNIGMAAGWLAGQSELVQMLFMGGHGGFPSLLSFLCNAAFQL